MHVHVHVYVHETGVHPPHYRHTDRQTDTQTDTQTDRQADRQTDRDAPPTHLLQECRPGGAEYLSAEVILKVLYEVQHTDPQLVAELDGAVEAARRVDCAEGAPPPPREDVRLRPGAVERGLDPLQPPEEVEEPQVGLHRVRCEDRAEGRLEVVQQREHFPAAIALARQTAVNGE